MRKRAEPRDISPARRAAFDVLMAVERGSAHADDLLRGKAVSALCDVDRNLATALVLGVLRWQIRLDRQIQQWLSRPGARLEPPVRIALRLGAFQSLQMDRIPAHAAIDESVELTKQAGHRFAARMVNAVLRKLAAAPHVAPSNTDAIEAHPAWMVERWRAFYGSESARAICRHGQTQPVQALRLEGAGVEEELAAAGVRLEPGEFLSSLRIAVAGNATETAAFREGRVRQQDEGSQLIAEIAAHPERKTSSILDACAAPGGKTLILAERNPHACIVACERNAERLKALRTRLAFLGDRVECRKADASALAEEAVYDVALADVPCSGTGTLGRNPEIRHRLKAEDLVRQAERQRAILRAVLRAIHVGGRVVYSTCSLEPEENEEVVAEALGQSTHAKLIPVRERIEELRRAGVLSHKGAGRLQACVTPEGYLRLLPGTFHTDGFFVALIERTG